MGVGLAFLAALVAFVIPAFGVVGSLITPRSLTEGLVPIERDLGGVNNDCLAVDSSAEYTVRFENPSSLPPMPITVGGKPVTITSTVSNIGGEQFYAFSITGAVARDVVGKGGSNSSHYAYDNPTVDAQTAFLNNGVLPAWSTSTPYYPARAKRAVAADSNLHATRASTGSKKLYTVSHVSFCLDTGAAISGSVFNDANGDGDQDGGELGVSGRTVRVYGGASPVTTVTDGSGAYSFPDVTLGTTYTVCQAPPGATFTQTLPGASTPLSANCATEGNRGYQLLLTSGQSGLDFGNVETASVTGRVFDDTDGDGADDAEPGLARTVNLYRNNDLVGSTTSLADGSFAFAGKQVGAGYKVCALGSSSLDQTVPTGPSTADCSVEGNRGYEFALASGGASGNVFGFIGLASVAGKIFDDANANGVDDGEGGISGRVVSLYGGSGLIETDTTDGTGGFSFASQRVGFDYTVCVAEEGGQVQTYPVQGTPGSAACTGAAETDRGWGFTLTTAGVSNLGFGSVPAVIGSCADPFGIEPGYLIKLAGGPDPCDKAFVIAYGDEDGDGNRFASLQPVSGQGTIYAMVERITWTLPADGQQFDLQYDDIVPFASGDAGPMLYCNLDPRDPAGADPEFDLLPAYLPAGAASVLPAGESSCLIDEDASTLTGKYIAFIYSAIDGLRLPNG